MIIINKAKDFFKFEDKSCDLPFYGDYFPLSKIGFVALAIAFIIPIIVMFGGIKLPIPFGILLLILGLIAIAIASKGNFKSICKKLKLSDAKIIILVIVLEYIFTMAIVLVEEQFGMHSNFNPGVSQASSLMLYVQMIFFLFGEELFKLIGLFLFMYIFYKLTKNRKLSLVVAAFISLSVFGLLHAPEYGNAIHALVAIGWASVFTLYAYIKTRNIFVSYIAHLIFDVLIFLMAGLTNLS